MHPADALLALALAAFAMSVYRVARGPADADRAVAADLAFFSFVAAVAVAGVRSGAALLTVVLVAALIGCLSSFALARLLDREEDR